MARGSTLGFHEPSERRDNPRRPGEPSLEGFRLHNCLGRRELDPSVGSRQGVDQNPKGGNPLSPGPCDRSPYPASRRASAATPGRPSAIARRATSAEYRRSRRQGHRFGGRPDRDRRPGLTGPPGPPLGRRWSATAAFASPPEPENPTRPPDAWSARATTAFRGVVPDPGHRRLVGQVGVEVILPGLVRQDPDGRPGLGIERPAGQLADRRETTDRAADRGLALTASRSGPGPPGGRRSCRGPSRRRPRTGRRGCRGPRSRPGPRGGRACRRCHQRGPGRGVEVGDAQGTDQGRDGVGAGLSEPLDGVVLLRPALREARR